MEDKLQKEVELLNKAIVNGEVGDDADEENGLFAYITANCPEIRKQCYGYTMYEAEEILNELGVKFPEDYRFYCNTYEQFYTVLCCLNDSELENELINQYPDWYEQYLNNN